ncbi:hypothetical protein [Herpetosiphon sp. NSE202]|uniref:hypothetical protein n=1 Tax=Herpetosiphon sp. NSE202 TaxID=3351349 RepID=UPI00363B69D1
MSRIRASFRIAIVLLALLFLVGPVFVARAQTNPAQAPVQSAAIPNDTQYLWIAGSSFQTRDSTTAFETTRNTNNQPTGCIYATSSGEFTAPVAVPNGATILGLDYYLNDTGTSQTKAELTLNDSDMIMPRELITVEISSSIGLTNTYAPIRAPYAPYVVNMQNRGLFLEWFPRVTNASMQLCGVRIAYTAPAEPRPATDYLFIVGSTLVNTNSATEHGYAGAGCTFVKINGRTLNADVDLPQGSQLTAVRTYFRDVNSADLTVKLIASNGQGVTNTLATLTRPVSDTALVNADQNLNYTVNESNESLSVVADFAGVLSNQLRLCGVRFQYSNPTTEPTQDSRFITGSTFVPRRSNVNYSSDANGCVNVSNEIEDLTANVTAPEGAKAARVTFYYKNAAAGPTLNLYSFVGSGEFTQITSVPVMGTGTQNSVSINYPIENTDQGLALVWDASSASSEYALCGAKIDFLYTQQVFLPIALNNY